MRSNSYQGSRNIIGAKIRALRLANRLTQQELAASLQLKGHPFDGLIISRIEKGNRLVFDFEVKILAKEFGVTYEYLLGD